MEKAVQQSLLSKASADSKYESNINMLNKQLIKLRPNATKLQVEDVKAESRQGDCLFAAIIMQYKARCSALPGMAQHTTSCLPRVCQGISTGRHAVGSNKLVPMVGATQVRVPIKM